jgi:N-ethylmaleimide reductase
MAPFDEPVELTTDEVVATIDDYRGAAAHAVAAGFDGVELHGTSGYLPAQFLSTGTNHRTDRYGGSVENRIRFVVETLEALADEVGSGRVGLRVCPGNPFNDLHDDDPAETFTALFGAIEPMALAYLHVIRMNAGVDNLVLARRHSSAPLIVNDSYDVAEAEQVVAGGTAAAVSFARAYIANPDLVERIRRGVDLTAFDRKALYTVGPEGYTDYPTVT